MHAYSLAQISNGGNQWHKHLPSLQSDRICRSCLKFPCEKCKSLVVRQRSDVSVNPLTYSRARHKNTQFDTQPQDKHTTNTRISKTVCQEPTIRDYIPCLLDKSHNTIRMFHNKQISHLLHLQLIYGMRKATAGERQMDTQTEQRRGKREARMWQLTRAKKEEMKRWREEACYMKQERK